MELLDPTDAPTPVQLIERMATMMDAPTSCYFCTTTIESEDVVSHEPNCPFALLEDVIAGNPYVVRADAAASRAPSELTRYELQGPGFLLAKGSAMEPTKFSGTKVYRAAEVDALLAAGACAVPETLPCIDCGRAVEASPFQRCETCWERVFWRTHPRPAVPVQEGTPMTKNERKVTISYGPSTDEIHIHLAGVSAGAWLSRDEALRVWGDIFELLGLVGDGAAASQSPAVTAADEDEEVPEQIVIRNGRVEVEPAAVPVQDAPDDYDPCKCGHPRDFHADENAQPNCCECRCDGFILDIENLRDDALVAVRDVRRCLQESVRPAPVQDAPSEIETLKANHLRQIRTYQDEITRLGAKYADSAAPSDAHSSSPAQDALTLPSSDELRWVEHAASLRGQTAEEYVKRAINAALRKQGVDAVLFGESDDEPPAVQDALTTPKAD